MSTLYDDLGITKDAEAADVKKAYRKKAAEHHPDKGGEVADFQPVAHTYTHSAFGQR